MDMFTPFPTYSHSFLGNNMQHFTMLPSGVCACWPIYLRFLSGLLSKYLPGPTLIAFWDQPSLSRVAISYDVDGPRLDCILHYNPFGIYHIEFRYYSFERVLNPCPNIAWPTDHIIGVEEGCGRKLKGALLLSALKDFLSYLPCASSLSFWVIQSLCDDITVIMKIALISLW